jgi:uncharacterized protein
MPRSLGHPLEAQTDLARFGGLASSSPRSIETRPAALSPAARSFRERFGGAALVTGASSGIGEAFVWGLAQRGMDVIAVARREERLRALKEMVEARHSVRVVVEASDLAREGASSALAKTLGERGLAVGLLVNNAGFGWHGRFEDCSGVRQAEMVALNCRLPVELTHACLPAMLERGRGGIIFISSTAAFQPTPFLATYGATKAFLLMLAEALCVELGPRGIEVLAMAPGFTRTEFQVVAGCEGMQGLGRPTTPQEVVETALSALGSRPTAVHGWLNRLAAFAVRLLPRAFVARSAGRWNPVPASNAHARRHLALPVTPPA